VNEVIHEMLRKTFAHQTGNLAKWCVPTRFDPDEQNAVGLLHWEMRAAGRDLMTTADANARRWCIVVDRGESGYSHINRAPLAYPGFSHEEIDRLLMMVSGSAAGPFTHQQGGPPRSPPKPALKRYFFDAIAPITNTMTTSDDQAWMQSRAETIEERQPTSTAHDQGRGPSSTPFSQPASG
jgi:methylenetetrahydrofolate--tRNA-(uracil-5-)-methyltransferase